RKLQYFRDVRLAVKRHPVRVKSGGKPCRRDFQRRAVYAFWIEAMDQRVVVREEVEALDRGLPAREDCRAHRADVVAKMRGAGCRYSSEYPMNRAWVSHAR